LTVRVARFFLVQHTKRWDNIPSGYKIYQLLPLQDPPKFTRIRVFGLKIDNLATLLTVLVLGYFSKVFKIQIEI
jgi:hypothetical protein